MGKCKNKKQVQYKSVLTMIPFLLFFYQTQNLYFYSKSNVIEFV